MTTSTLPFSRVWFARFTPLLAAMSLGLAVPAGAAQETFWPFNLFPAPGSSLSYTNASTISAEVPGVGTITTRHARLSDFSNPIVLPAAGDSAVYYNANTRFDTESSLDGGANWAAYLGSGATSLTLRQTNDTAGVRRFEMDLSSGSIPVNGSFGAATVRESPTLASLGELVVTATNGGFFYSGFVNFNLEVSVDNGASWYAFSSAAYVELSGVSAAPARLAILTSGTTIEFSWRTEALGQYQLQATDTLGGTNWINVGTPQAGTGAETFVFETLSTATNQFYRLQLSP